MKKNSLLLLLVCSVLTAKAQPFSPISKLYLNISAIIKPQKPEDGSGAEIGLSTVIRNKWSASISYHQMVIHPSNLPADFKPGHKDGLAFFLPYDGPYLNPNVSVKLYSLTVGRYYSIGKRSWMQFEGGLSIVNGEKTKFEKQAVSRGTVNYLLGYENYETSNYSMAVEKKNAIGGLVRADIQHAIGRNLAIGFSAGQEISSVQSPLFFELRILAGHFGLPKKISKPKTKTK